MSANLILQAADEAPKVVKTADLISKSIAEGGKVLWCGNGGSAADAQHLAAELVGRYKVNRSALASIALTTDTSVLTAISNDFGFEYVFSRQVEALGKLNDVLIGITTSGNSPSVLNALQAASKIGMRTVVMTGASAPRNLAEVEIRVNSQQTELIQQCHIAIGHVICELVEAKSVDSK